MLEHLEVETMVSPLSSRIFSLEAKKTNKSFPSQFPGQGEGTGAVGAGGKKRISGYMADRESRDSPTIRVSDKKSRRSNEVELTAKRQKLAQLNFQASRARADLADVGIHCPAGIFVGKSKLHFPGPPIDKSKVELYIATKEKPYTDATKLFSGNVISPSNSYAEISCDYGDIIRDSRSFYAASKPISYDKDFLNQHQPDPSTTGSNDTPSESSESDSEDAGSINIPARVEEDDQFGSSSKERLDGSQRDSTTFRFSASPRTIITEGIKKETSLQEALMQRTPCVVTDVTRPHLIVHVNGSFSKLTNESHARALSGRPISDLFPTIDLADILSKSIVLHYEVSVMVSDDTKEQARKMKDLSLHLSVRPIFAVSKIANSTDTLQTSQPRTITHLSFEFASGKNEKESVIMAVG